MALLNGPGEVDSLDYRSRHEYWLKQISGGVESSGIAMTTAAGAITAAATVIATPVVVPSTTAAPRVVVNAADIEVSITPRYQVAANGSRKACRVTNNATASPTTPCDVILSYSTLSATTWDQVIRPGESVLLDAPALAFSIATISATPSSIGGGVIITSYLI